MADVVEDLSSVVFYQPQWIAMNGGWIHSNNVLFYFAQSPFFDRASANQTVIAQSQGIPEREMENLSTRQRFEVALSRQIGVQYVVEHDPLESKAKYKSPHGDEQSDVWVIRKQHRSVESNEETVKVVGYYYIMNQAIFQAPSIASVFRYRMLNTTRAMNDVFTTASSLPKFTVSHGHSYYTQTTRSQHTNPSTQVTATATATATSNISDGNSKEATPFPQSNTQPSISGGKTGSETDSKPTTHQHDTTTDARLLQQALRMSMRHGREHMDDMPLTGEPGNYRFTKTQDPSLLPSSQASSSMTLSQQQQQNIKTSRLGTPVPGAAVTGVGSSRAVSQQPQQQQSPTTTVPAIQTDVPAVNSKKSSTRTPGAGGNDLPSASSVSSVAKPRRRKSKAISSPVGFGSSA